MCNEFFPLAPKVTQLTQENELGITQDSYCILFLDGYINIFIAGASYLKNCRHYINQVDFVMLNWSFGVQYRILTHKLLQCMSRPVNSWSLVNIQSLALSQPHYVLTEENNFRFYYKSGLRESEGECCPKAVCSLLAGILFKPCTAIVHTLKST